MTTLELCDRAELLEDARKLALPDAAPRVFVQQLAGAGRMQDAIAALAQLLPNRGCVSWGLNSIRKVSAASTTPHAAPAFQAIEQWVAEPTEELRRTVHAAGEKAGISTPVGCLSFAVFLSGGTMAPAEAPVQPIEPAPHLCAKVVALSMTAAVAMDPQNAAELRRSFLDYGFHVADQLKIWEPEK